MTSELDIAQIRVTVRGGPRIVLPIKADVQLPEVEVVTDELDFGEVHVGSLASKDLTIK